MCYSHVFQERILNDEFDELMRSGATMKVSLTPDRLKTMEVSTSPLIRRRVSDTSFRCIRKRKTAVWDARLRTSVGLRKNPLVPAHHCLGGSMSLLRMMRI